MSQVRGEVSQVKDIMVQNIEKVLERSEHINILVDKTENLEHEVSTFFLSITLRVTVSGGTTKETKKQKKNRKLKGERRKRRGNGQTTTI